MTKNWDDQCQVSQRVEHWPYKVRCTGDQEYEIATQFRIDAHGAVYVCEVHASDFSLAHGPYSVVKMKRPENVSEPKEESNGSDDSV